MNVPREQVWPEVVALLAQSHWSAADLSVEPPWRMSVELDRNGTGLEFLQSTVLIRDDGPTCHVAWGLVFDPEPTEECLVSADHLLGRMTTELTEMAHRLNS